jgi:hypothetical protein
LRCPKCGYCGTQIRGLALHFVSNAPCWQAAVVELRRVAPAAVLRVTCGRDADGELTGDIHLDMQVGE